MEPMAAALMTFALAILLSSWVILIIVSFKEDFTWGLCSVFLPPLAYFYGLFNWSKAKEAILVALLGWILLFFAFG